MAKSDTMRYIDVDPSVLPQEVQAMLAEDRRLYDAQKALRAKITAAINEQITLKDGYTVVGIGFTRWGQFQFHADRVETKQAKVSNRPSLADFIDVQQANGRGV